MNLATTLLNSVATQGSAFRSLRFRSSANAYLNRTPATAGNRKTWTFSAWIKRGSVTAEGTLLSGGSSTGGGAAGRLGVFFNASGQLVSDLGGTGTYDQSTAVYRDPGAWYHFVWAFDTTQATAANRSRMYMNGVEVSLTQTRTFTQNTDYSINSADTQTIGVLSNSLSAYLFDGYMTNVYFVDGQQLTPSAFGRTNQQTGVWEPSYFQGTYGTNGYYLPFTNLASTTTLGYDYSGNSNNWTTNNFSLTSGATYDSMQDVPTLTSPDAANYAVLNPLWKLGGAGYITPTDGNLTVSSPGNNIIASSMPLPSTGKWYMEFTLATSVYPEYGMAKATSVGGGSQNTVFAAYNNGSNIWLGDGSYGSTDGNQANTSGDIGLIAVDVDNNKLWIGRSRSGTTVWMGGGDPSAGTNPSFSASGGGGVYATIFDAQIYNNPFVGSGGGSDVWNANFGQQSWISTPPTGFKPLNTYNLANSAVVQGNRVMDATTYTGNGGTLSVTNTAGFKPDFVWIKARSQAYEHELFDSTRGIYNYLSSNSTAIESNNSGTLTAFNSNGFSVGSGAYNNANGQTYVGWQWQAGQGITSTNNNGSIASTVSVNSVAGFSVVQYTVPASGNYTWGHGLPAAPQFIIIKGGYTTNTYNWDVYHASIGPTVRLVLNSTSAQQTYSGPWNDTAPTSTVVSQQNAWYATNDTNIAYCWTPVPGFSKFGSYTGNGSTDGPFVNCGFKPAFVMTKKSNGSGNWYMWDNKRNISANGDAGLLYAETDSAESDYNAAGVDLLSNGFKLRNSDSSDNGSSDTIVYVAFAENPFKNALAR